MENEIVFYKRDGEKCVEKAPGVGFLRFLYGNNLFGAFSLNTLVRRKSFSIWFGKYMSSSRSKSKIQPFIDKHKIDMSEYIEPSGGFQSFNQFFHRRIKDECRPLGDGFVCPADGRVVAFPTIEESTRFYIKGQDFDIPTFLGDKELAKKYLGGSIMVVRLAPVDYHRYHFPCDGTPGPSKLINGYLYSVSPVALKQNFRIFWENKREYCIHQSPDFGDVIICDVGATLTGTIIQTYEENKSIKKGDEKGHFAFGGSTLVILLPPNKIKWSEDLLKNSLNGKETYVKMGEKIGNKIED
jgi:phosphatidylserine decarboxylase